MQQRFVRSKDTKNYYRYDAPIGAVVTGSIYIGKTVGNPKATAVVVEIKEEVPVEQTGPA